MKRPGMLVALILAVGVAAAVVALHARESNTVFVVGQQKLKPVAASSLNALLLSTSDPRPGYAGRAREATCSAGSNEALGNPWTCLVAYPHPPRVRYRVRVYGSGAIYGSGQPVGAATETPLIVRGCCARP